MQPFRPTISLDGEWRLTMPDGTDHSVSVPGSYPSQIDGLREYSGWVVYSREIQIPGSWKGSRVFIRFGAVDYFCEVLVNGTRVGEHEGGYTPFEFSIGDCVRYGEPNEISVRVLDVVGKDTVDGFAAEEIPKGKQMWYGNAAGLLQSVWLEARASRYIESVAIDPYIDSPCAVVRVRFNDRVKGVLRVCVDAPTGADAILPAEIAVDADEAALSIPIPHPALWSPDSAALYRASVTLVVDGEEVDAVEAQFGMRKIEARGGRILLNGEPIFLAGALDQDFYPGTEYVAPSEEYLRDQFLKAKDLGLNCLRIHIKAADPRYLDMADRLGLLVWYEIPNWVTLTEGAKRRAGDTLKAMLARDHNHPSLVIVSIINEAWGVDLSKLDHQEWMAGMYDAAKALEPTRLIVDNSACESNFHVKSDIEDFHGYWQIPDQADEYRRWIADFASHPDWTFTSSSLKQRRGDEPLVLSEFGNWGLPRLSRLRECYGGEPWWLGADYVHTHELTSPHRVEERFHEQGLGRVFGDFDGLADAYQWQEWLALKFQIEEMRKLPSISGYVITEFTDLHWESNGLLDYCRNPKVFHDLMRTVQAQDIVFVSMDRFNWTAGEAVEADVWVSHFSGRDLGGARVEWDLEGAGLAGHVDVGAMARADARVVGKISLSAPAVESPARMRLRLKLIGSSGEAINENYAELAVFPAVSPEMPGDVVVAGALDAGVLRRVSDGASAVICAESPDALAGLAGAVRVVDRHERGRWGAWCNSVIWFADRPAFEGVPMPKTLEFSFEGIVPAHVLEGVPAEHWGIDVLSGIFVGWVHVPAAIAVQVRIGQGRAIITTLPLLSARERDPMARWLLAGLADYVRSNECRPAI